MNEQSFALDPIAVGVDPERQVRFWFVARRHVALRVPLVVVAMSPASTPLDETCTLRYIHEGGAAIKKKPHRSEVLSGKQLKET